MATNNSVNSSLSGTTGTGNFVGSTSPSLTTPKVITGINDTNGNAIINLSATASAVNNINVTNSITGQTPAVQATGSDTNIILGLVGKGTGGCQVQGTTAGGNAVAGYVGEVISSQVTSGSPVSLSNGVAADITSISLTAGDWNVTGNINIALTGVNTGSAGWNNTTSATAPDSSLYATSGPSASLTNNVGFAVPTRRYNITTTTTIYLSAVCAFSTGAANASGLIMARRMR